MAVIRAILFLTISIYLYDASFGQSDLRSALAAVDRRQKEIANLEQQEQYGFNPYDPSEEIAFLNNAPDNHIYYDKDYVDDDGPISKRPRSSFRERMDEDRENKLEQLAKNLYNNLDDNRVPSGVDMMYMRELYDRFYGNNDNNYPVNNPAKRYYPIYGMQNVGLRKRGRFVDDNEEPSYAIHHHIPRQEEDPYTQDCLSSHQIPYNPEYGNTRRFVVAKRSSTSTVNKAQKRSIKKQTDPKVEKDLSNIFGNEKNLEMLHNKLEDVAATTPKTEAKAEEGTLAPRKIEKKDKPKLDPKDDLNKEIFEPVAPMNDEGLNLRKKAIDWSDYFGLDRRKKSGAENHLDKEWLMERYHKAVAMSPKKRSIELSSHNHQVTAVKRNGIRELEQKQINEMDMKLAKLEDEIVDDALKYTGAHHDEPDSKEVQRVKDNIISRLAQAYNIEKMRNALEEYKLEMEKARKEMKSQANRGPFAEGISEEKRVAVPRKQAIDDTRDTVDGDNNIKCANGEDCHEQTYHTPTDLLENHFASLECPAIQRACNDVSSLVGPYGHVFEPACNMHQMCLICSNNSWFSPTRQCNTLFLTKAFELCLGKDECKKEARRSLKYLMDINKSLQAQAILTEECEVQCPEGDIFSK